MQESWSAKLANDLFIIFGHKSDIATKRDKVMIQVSAVATVRSITAIANALSEQLGNKEECVLDVSDIIDCDLSILQLIECGRQYAKSSGQLMTLDRPANAVVTALLRRAGFLTAPTPADLDFWFHGAPPQ